jgi:hypothetical protein
MPPTKSAPEKRKELTANWDIPLIICPEVQPPPKRAPNSRRKPPINDQTKRDPGFAPNLRSHSTGTTLIVKRPVAHAAIKAPIGIPKTKKNS